MLKVISFKICPFAQRITALLEAKQMPYEVQYLCRESEKPQWFLALSPTGQVPVLVTGNRETLFESEAIVEYIDEVAPPLRQLTPAHRAVERAWGYQAAKNYVVQCGAVRSHNQATLRKRTDQLDRAFVRAEARFGDGPFFCGDTLGNVDVAWLPLLHRAELIRRYADHDFLAAYPKLRAWQAALMTSGLPDKSVADGFMDEFKGLYLSDRTYLGTRKDGPDYGPPACAGSYG